ncbi:MAG TPA: DedA family protein [Pseudonocardiaceae bacterium]|jgi:membrane protein DedA with SNARE-associated domain|nr:DedA family protein [Pseudonocardiaceae bacterium]
MPQFIAHYGYVAVFLLMVAESACIPIPSELIMLLAGALAGGAVAGAHLDLVTVIVLGALGNVVGSYLAWAVGRYAGRSAVRRWGRYVLLTEHDVDRAQRWFDRHGTWSVLVGRVVPVVRTFISLPAGLATMPPLRFGVATAVGCLPWTAALGVLGYVVGTRWQAVADAFHGPTYALAGLVAVLLVAGAVVFVRRRLAELRREREQAA